MPKIKLFRSYDFIDGEYGNFLKEHSVGWQEVTDEELNFLISKEGRKFLNNNYSFEYSIVIFQDDTDKIPELIQDLKAYVKKQKELLTQQEKEKIKRGLEIKAKKEAKQIEKAKKLLEAKGLI